MPSTASPRPDQGLRLGADVYLTKPIKFPELAAQIEAICRRVVPPGHPAEQASVPLATANCGPGDRIGGKGAHRAQRKGIQFPPCAGAKALACPRESLLIGMGENDDLVAARRMDMLVYRLRKKIRTRWDVELPLRSTYGGGFSLSVAFGLV